MGGTDLRARKRTGNRWRVNLAVMEVRCRKPHEQCDSTCTDFFSCSDCSKTLTHDELDALLNPHGLRRISHYYRSHAVSAIYQYQ